MGLERFDFAALVAFDGGRIKTAIEQALARCEADCADRPGDDKARKITLTISLNPVLDEDRPGELHGCDIQFQVHDTVPKRSSKIYSLRAKSGGGLFFNEISKDDPDQMTFPVEEKAGLRVVGGASNVG